MKWKRSYWNIYGDRIRTYEEACNTFNDLHLIPRSIVTKTLPRLKTTGFVKSLPKTGRQPSATNKVFRENIAIDLEKSLQTSTIILALYHGISWRFVHKKSKIIY